MTASIHDILAQVREAVRDQLDFSFADGPAN